LKAEQSFRHQFLLAMPGLADGYFGGTVTYLCEHGPDGAMGLVINRPSEMALAELLGQLGIDLGSDLKDAPRGATAARPVLEGGPVSRERGFVLHTDDCRYDVSLELGEGLVLTASREALEAIAAGDGPERYLVALGFAGWGPGQLEQEMMDNAWLNCPVDNAVIFDVPYEERVVRAAATLGIDFKMLSGHAGHA
jgi:putative transcriptional regulator